MLIAQISDSHVQLPGGELDRLYDTAGHLARAIAHLNALDPQPDVVLLTGDTVDAGKPVEYARLRTLLQPLRAPLFVIPGNHDERETLRDAFRGDGYLPHEGFLNYVVNDWPLRLIGLDTVVPGEPGGQLCQARLRWLDARLAEAPTRPTVLFLHHPPFHSGMTLMDRMGLHEPEGLARVVASHTQVRHVLAGHLHRPVVTAFAGTLASTCPSTGHQVALDLPPNTGLSVVMEPPAVTLLYCDERTDTLVHHLSYIGDRPRHLLHDGQAWQLHEAPPAGFRG